MTSTASQPTTTPAPTTSASTAPSYASAAGATKKPASTPLVVTGGPSPATVAGSSAASGQQAKNASGNNLNGRPSVSPAVPTVANGTSSLNGDAANHTRNGSVTIAAPGNGYNNKATAPGIQFGFEKTPQPTPAAPVTIPGAQRIPSPAHSPSPIPQPSASGGKPGSTESAFKIGSFTNDGDRMAMRPNSMQMPFHSRRDSSVSQHSDMGHHGGPGPNRGGYPPQGGRGARAFNPQYNGGQMGFPPNNFPRGPHGPNRGGMPAQNFAGRGGMQYPNSPQPARGSPAMPHAIPGQGTPNMNAAMPVPPPQYAHQHQYPPPMSGGYAPQVKTLSSQASFLPFNQKAPNKKKFARWDLENRLSRFRQPDPSVQHSGQDLGGKSRRLSKQRDSATDYDRSRGRGPMLDHQAPPYHPQVPYDAPVDLTPGSDGFAHLEQMLTANKQNFNNYGFDPTRAPYMGMPAYNPQMPMGGYAPGSPAPGGYPYAPGGQFAVPQGQPMSRNNSQMSERPASATGNPNQMGAPGPPQPQKPIIATSTPSNQFVRPKSKQIKIRNAAGEEVSLASLTTTTTASPAAASPAPSIQQSKTPPVIASTPTPPPKASTPAPKASTPTSQGREESASEAKGDDIRAIFLEQVKKSKEGEAEATKTDDKPAVEEAKPVEEKQEVEQAKPEEKADEPTPTPAPAPVEAEPKPKDEPEVKPKDEPEAKVEPEKTEVAPKADEKPAETEDEYMERMIREMEEEDARREAEQAKITAQKTAEKEAAKKKADEERLASSAENDRKLREQEREMERLEEEKERKAREQSEAAEDGKSVAELLAGKISDLTASQKKDTSSVADKLGKLTINNTRDPSALSPGSGPSSAKSTGKDRRPAALNLAPLKTGSVEAPPPSAAMQALKSARFLTIKDEIKYPSGISSPNPATNAAAAKKGGSFKYDSAFLLQFQKAFTEQPSVEFSQQVKALIGDSDGTRSASTRGSGQGPRTGSKNGPSGGAFGSFTQPASGKPLPPGTTSDQRFAMAQGQMARPMSGAMSFGRGGAFPGPSQMSRTASNLGMNSRSGSRTQTRGGSKQGHPQADAKLAKTMPLTQGMDLKPITTSSSGWKPMSLTRNAAQSAEADYMAPDVVQRKVKAALNKMTPENFEKISKQILEIAAQSKDEQDGRTLRQVIQLTFEKATDEAHWAAMYAKFCKRMLENMSPEVKDVTITDKNGNVVSGGALFRKYLLNRCQEDFERGWNVDMPEPKEGESKETAMMSDEYYKAMTVKRRGLGLVQFIGELFKLGMLTERIMHECVRKLLDFKDEPDEAEIESLSKLLRTIGGNLDSTEKGHAFMNAYFERISNLVASPELPSRLKFMLMDIVDLRKKQWAEKEGLKGPKTLDEIRAEAEAAAAAKAAEASRSNTRHQPGGRSQMGRGDARNSYNTFHPPASNTVGMDDLRRLKGTASRTASGNVTLGPTSMFNSRSNSGRKLGPGGSLTRGNEDSAASSRTGTPPTQASVNAFAALANMPGESENPASPPSTSASPALNPAKPDTSK